VGPERLKVFLELVRIEGTVDVIRSELVNANSTIGQRMHSGVSSNNPPKLSHRAA
jgi:hypothetical protein